MAWTAGCEPGLRACDTAAGGTAYWSILPADKNHYGQTALILLIGLELIMILGSGWPRSLFFFFVTRALQSLDAAHLFYDPLPCKTTQRERDPICDIPRVARYDSGWQWSASRSEQRPASPRVGSIYPSMCDSTPSGKAHWHQFVSAVGSQP